jgi:hypothetical protein
MLIAIILCGLPVIDYDIDFIQMNFSFTTIKRLEWHMWFNIHKTCFLKDWFEVASITKSHDVLHYPILALIELFSNELYMSTYKFSQKELLNDN